MSTERKTNVPAAEQKTTAPPPARKPGAPATDRKNTPVHLRPRPFRLKVHGWLRWLHIYISMFSLLAILFFSLTGIMLNHPDWSFTDRETKVESKGQLPEGWKKGKDADWFRITEFLRQKAGVRGVALEPQLDDQEGSISFEAPSYKADCFFDPQKGSYELTVTTHGFVAMLNDFHRGGNSSGTAWRWVIDFSGGLLAIVALTGLGLLWYLKKMRVAAFIVLGVGIAIIICAMKLAF